MKFRMVDGGLSVDTDAQAMSNLVKRMDAITQAIELFNQSDWKMQEVAMWLQYEKEVALLESTIYQRGEQ